MGFFDAILGRTKPKQANLDQLFGLPSAAITLQAATSFAPTGVGAVAFRQVEGAAFDQVEQEIHGLLGADPALTFRQVNDGFGYTWAVLSEADDDISNLVTSLHAVNSSLEGQGFGPMLLCSALYFRDTEARTMALVYLYKRGSFYPFVQLGPQRRDSAVEMQIRGVVGNDVNTEADLSKWSPLWDAPGMTED